jgi:hypothetical protein
VELDLYRLSSAHDSTLGVLLVRDGMADRRFLCFTLEDEARTVKVYAETRIPAGRYRLGLRTAGDHHRRYALLFPDLHRGMVEILGVPGFTAILFHIGNRDDDTAGCVLVGDAARQNVTQDGWIGESKAAYARVYPQIAEPLVRAEAVWLNVLDVDTPLAAAA